MFAKVLCFVSVLIATECGTQGPKDIPRVSHPCLPAAPSSLPVGLFTNISSNPAQNAPGLGNLMSTLGSAGQSSNVLAPLDTMATLSQSIMVQINEERSIVRPCRPNDVACIRHFFVYHGKCHEAHGPVPDPLTRKVSTTYHPRINMTLTATDIMYSGLNGNIVEFLIDKETDNLLITIQFSNVTYYSNNTYYRFHRKGKLPVVNKDNLKINFKSFSTTTIIPQIRDLRLDKSNTYTFIDDSNPTIFLGPKAFVSSDPAIPATLPELYTDVRTGLQEFFLTEGTFCAAAFIQKVICDFGLELL